VAVAITDIEDPKDAIQAYLAGNLAPVDAPPPSA
jgi:hypothetical protein